MEATTKIVGGLSEFKEKKQQSDGLLNRLKKAKTPEEVEYLLSVGKAYKNVHPATMKKWVKVAYKKGLRKLVVGL